MAQALDRITDQLENVVEGQSSLVRSMREIMAMQAAIKNSLQTLESLQRPGLEETTSGDLAGENSVRASDTESTRIAD